MIGSTVRDVTHGQMGKWYVPCSDWRDPVGRVGLCGSNTGLLTRRINRTGYHGRACRLGLRTLDLRYSEFCFCELLSRKVGDSQSGMAIYFSETC